MIRRVSRHLWKKTYDQLDRATDHSSSSGLPSVSSPHTDNTNASAGVNVFRPRRCKLKTLALGALIVVFALNVLHSRLMYFNGERLPSDYLLGPLKGVFVEYRVLFGVWRQKSAAPIPVSTNDGCCFHVRTDLDKKLTPEYFESKRQAKPSPLLPWTGHEYEDWLQIRNTSLRDDGNMTQRGHCRVQWNRLVMDQSPFDHYESIQLMKELLREGEETTSDRFPFVEDKPELPRILFLGDSISMGVWVEFLAKYRNLNLINIHTAPSNCGSFLFWDSYLDDWLGSCQWDLIHFNIGQHFLGWKAFQDRLPKYVKIMREHSPNVKIVYATTTPSPFDKPDTTPKREDCPHYTLFRKAGTVAKLNEIARTLLEPMGVLFNDRYSLTMPRLKEIQGYCDVHFHPEGYRLMADQDWNVITSVLGLDSAGNSTSLSLDSTRNSTNAILEHSN